MRPRKKTEAPRAVASQRAPLDAHRVSRALAILRREAPGWNAPIVGFIAMQSRDPFKTLISCILSLRTKDQTTAVASARLFARADTPAKMLALTREARGFALPAKLRAADYFVSGRPPDLAR